MSALAGVSADSVKKVMDTAIERLLDVAVRRCNGGPSVVMPAVRLLKEIRDEMLTEVVFVTSEPPVIKDYLEDDGA